MPVIFQDRGRGGNTSPQIITDEKNGTVTIMIDGKAAMQIDKDGVHVPGNITFGGTLTDAGRAYVEKAIAGGDDAE